MNDRNWGGRRKGSGRKPTGSNTKNVTLTLTKHQAELLKWSAAIREMTISQYVVQKLYLDEDFSPYLLQYKAEVEKKKKEEENDH